MPIVFRHTFATPTSDVELREALGLPLPDPPADGNNAGPQQAKPVPTFLAPHEWASVHPLGMKMLWKEHAEFAVGRKVSDPDIYLPLLHGLTFVHLACVEEVLAEGPAAFEVGGPTLRAGQMSFI